MRNQTFLLGNLNINMNIPVFNFYFPVSTPVKSDLNFDISNYFEKKIFFQRRKIKFIILVLSPKYIEFL